MGENGNEFGKDYQWTKYFHINTFRSFKFTFTKKRDAFIAALLLDPRFAWNSTGHEVFNDLLRSRGVDHLLKTHHFIHSQRQLAEIPRQPENVHV